MRGHFFKAPKKYKISQFAVLFIFHFLLMYPNKFEPIRSLKRQESVIEYV